MGCLQTDFRLHDLGSSSRVLTLVASAPYSDGVFMITALKSTLPQLWRVFATAIAPMSSTSEKMSVSMMMALGLSSLERQLAVADSNTRTARRRNDIGNMAVQNSEDFRPCVDMLQRHTKGQVLCDTRADVRQPHHDMIW